MSSHSDWGRSIILTLMPSVCASRPQPVRFLQESPPPTTRRLMTVAGELLNGRAKACGPVGRRTPGNIGNARRLRGYLWDLRALEPGPSLKYHCGDVGRPARGRASLVQLHAKTAGAQGHPSLNRHLRRQLQHLWIAKPDVQAALGVGYDARKDVMEQNREAQSQDRHMENNRLYPQDAHPSDR